MTTTAAEHLRSLPADRKNAVALHTLAAAYRSLHAVLNGDEPSAEMLSDAYDKVGLSLQMLGTNGDEALRGIV